VVLFKNSFLGQHGIVWAWPTLAGGGVAGVAGERLGSSA
jgi:hypothetical protein